MAAELAQVTFKLEGPFLQSLSVEGEYAHVDTDYEGEYVMMDEALRTR